MKSVRHCLPANAGFEQFRRDRLVFQNQLRNFVVEIGNLLDEIGVGLIPRPTPAIAMPCAIWPKLIAKESASAPIKPKRTSGRREQKQSRHDSFSLVLLAALSETHFDLAF